LDEEFSEGQEDKARGDKARGDVAKSDVETSTDFSDLLCVTFASLR